MNRISEKRQHQINMKAALKWALQNENIHTAIPGFTTFDQMNLDLTVMEDLTLTQQERIDLRLDKKRALTGLYCQQCEKCISQCRKKLEIPTYMRGYMYAYGYRNLGLARDILESLNLSDIPCSNCSTCNVNCTMGFDVKNKMLDIVRLKDVPKDFLA